MSDIFLYLLGAGASCQALPLASNFAERLTQFAGELRNAGPRITDLDESELPTDDPVWGRGRKTFAEAIEWLSGEASHHASVDTFAKKLFFRQDLAKLKKLKAVLSAYLAAEQARKNVDLRYDSFLASILRTDAGGSIALPGNIRILTWNYDTQLDKAFYGFCEDGNLVAQKISLNEAHVYRINGRCGTNPPGHVDTRFFCTYGSSEYDPWSLGISLYEEYIQDFAPEPEIHFSWEDSVQTRFKTSRLNLEDVTEIVAIGYSFPYFNREIDDLIFKQLYHPGRIYLQYPQGVHAAIEERLARLAPKAVWPDLEVIRIEGTDSFYIPEKL